MTATPLATKRLGATGLEVTRLRAGARAIGGGGWEHGWGPQDVFTKASQLEGPDHDPILSAAELTDQDAAEFERSAR